MTGIGRVEGSPRFLQEHTERSPFKVIKACELTFSDVKQMAGIVDAAARISEDDFIETPYLDHPLGIRIKFAEGIKSIRNPFPVTTISFITAVSSDIGEDVTTQMADIVLRGMYVELFDDRVVLNSPGVVWKEHQEIDIVDRFTITRESYKSERTPFFRMY